MARKFNQNSVRWNIEKVKNNASEPLERSQQSLANVKRAYVFLSEYEKMTDYTTQVKLHLCF